MKIEHIYLLIFIIVYWLVIFRYVSFENEGFTMIDSIVISTLTLGVSLLPIVGQMLLIMALCDIFTRSELSKLRGRIKSDLKLLAMFSPVLLLLSLFFI